MAFEVGSIFARIKLDTDEFRKGVGRAIGQARRLKKELAAELTGAGEAITGPITAAATAAGQKLKPALEKPAKEASRAIDQGLVRPTQKALARIDSAAKQTRRSVRSIAARGQFSQLGVGVTQASNAMAELRRNAILPGQAISRFQRLRQGLSGIGASALRSSRGLGRLAATFSRITNVIGLITGAGLAGFRLLRRSITALFNPIRFLSRLLFSLQGILAAIGAIQLVKVAGQVDAISIAFRNLSSSVGTVSTTLLRRLRVATRGAVSDLELMRVTNNAVLLGVVRSEEQFEQLATTARRLGRAVGRDPVEAIGDLSLGIGRQSRLILDNLGLIVKVEEANRAYARSLGVVESELTGLERREAFFIAVTEAARLKLNELGDDALTVADQIGRFRASFANIFADVARELVGEGSTFASIADFFEENRTTIRAFASSTANAFRDLGSQIADFVTGVTSGDIGIQQVIDTLIEDASRFLAAGIKVLTELVVRLTLDFIAALPVVLGSALATAVVEIFIQIATLVIDAIADLVREAGKLLVRGAFGLTRILSPGGAAALKVINFDEARELKEIDDFFDKIKDGVQVGADAIRSITTEPLIEFGTTTIARNFGATFAEFGRDSVRELNDELEETNTTLGKLVSRFRAIFKESLALNQSNPTFGVSAVQLEKALQPLEEFRQQIEGVRKSLANDLGPEFNQLTGELLQGLQPALIKVNEALVNLNKLTAVQKFDADEFANKITVPVNQAVTELNRNLRIDVDATTAIKELQKFEFELDQINKRLASGQVLTPELQFELLGKTQQLTTAALGTELKEATDFTAELRAELAELNTPETLRGVDALRGQFERFSRQLEETREKSAEIFGDAGLDPGEFEDLEGALESTTQLITGLKDELRGASIDVFGATLAAQIDRAKLRIAEFQTLLEAGIRTGLPDSRLNELRLQIAVITEEAKELSASFNTEGIDQLNDAISKLERKRSEIEIALNFSKQDEDTLKLLGETLVAQVIQVRLNVQSNLKSINEESRDINETLARGGDIAASRVEEFGRAAQKALAEAQSGLALARANFTEGTLQGLNPATIAALDLEVVKFEASVKRLQDQLKNLPELIGAVRFINLTRDISRSILTGIVDGFASGEKASKVFAKVTADIFRRAMEDSINRITTFFSQQLAKLFDKLPGLGSAGALATGLVALGTGVLTALNNRGSDVTVDDFESAINSSENIRGVVAGPTNVAISKVGDQLKTALATTEQLLLRIVISLESGGGGGGGGGSFANPGTGFTLSPSSTS
jgi:hypothetical protein